MQPGGGRLAESSERKTTIEQRVQQQQPLLLLLAPTEPSRAVHPLRARGVRRGGSRATCSLKQRAESNVCMCLCVCFLEKNKRLPVLAGRPIGVIQLNETKRLPAPSGREPAGQPSVSAALTRAGLPFASG